MFLERLRHMRDEVARAATAPDTAPAADPTGLGAKVNKRSVQLTWTASAGDTGSVGGGTSGVAGYDVWRSSAGKPLARVGSTTASAYTDNVTGAKTAYTYVVKTYDGAGNRSTGVTLTVTA